MVVDKTGFTGIFDGNVRFAPDESPANVQAQPEDISGPSIFTALEEQLGLKLEPAKGLVDVLVIDDVKKPSEN